MLGLKPPGCGFNFTHYAEEISAQNFEDLFTRVASLQQSLSDPGHIRNGVNACRQRSYAVKIRAQTYMVNAGNFGDVVNMIDERLERGTRKLCRR